MTLRFGSLADQGPLARLAALDSAAPRVQPVLLVEVDGQLRAALALTGAAVFADPFCPTADLIDLLHARALRLDATPGSDVPGGFARGLDGEASASVEAIETDSGFAADRLIRPVVDGKRALGLPRLRAGE